MNLKKKAEIEENIHKLTNGLRNGIDKTAKLNIFACLDQSGSIKQENFYFIKKCLKNLINTFEFNDKSFENSETVFGFLRFNDQVTLDQDCSNNKQALIKFVDDPANMIYQPGGTHTGKALETALNSLKKAQQQRLKSFNIIFLLTDDDLETGKPIIQKLNQSDDTRLITTFVNYQPPQKIYLEYGLKESYVVIFSSFEQLEIVFQEILDIVLSNPPLIENILACPNFIEIKFNIPSQTQKSKQIDYFEIEISNEKKVSQLKQTYAYDFLPIRIEINKTLQKKKIYLKYRAIFKNSFLTKWSSEDPEIGFTELFIHDQLSDISESFKLEPEKFRLQKHEPIKIDLQELDQKIPKRFKEREVDFLNIIFMGIVGAGKSSLINTLASIFAGKFKNICPYASEKKTHTRFLKTVSIVQNESINCLDTFGIEFDSTTGKEDVFENSNYKKVLYDILSGRIMPGFDLKDNQSPIQSEYYQQHNFIEKINTRIHAICIAVDMKSATDKCYCDSLISFIQAINAFSDQKNQYQPIIVLTKADIVFKDYLLSSMKSDNLRINEIDFRNLICENTHSLSNDFDRFIKNMNSAVQPENVFVFSNYQGPYSEPDFYKEYLGMLILKRLVDQAQEYVDNKFQNHYRIEFDSLLDKNDVYVDMVNLDKPRNTNLVELRKKIDQVLYEHRIAQKIKDEKYKWRFLTKRHGDPVIWDDEQKTQVMDIYFPSNNQRTIKITQRINLIEDPNYCSPQIKNIQNTDQEEQKKAPQHQQQQQKQEQIETQKLKLRIIVYENYDSGEKLATYLQELSFSQTLLEAKAIISEFQEIDLTDFVFLNCDNSPQTDENMKIRELVNKEKQLVLIKKPMQQSNKELIEKFKINFQGQKSKQNFNIEFDINSNLATLRQFLIKEDYIQLLSSNDRFVVTEQDEKFQVAPKLEGALKITDAIEFDSNKKKNVYLLNKNLFK